MVRCLPVMPSLLTADNPILHLVRTPLLHLTTGTNLQALGDIRPILLGTKADKAGPINPGLPTPQLIS